MGRYEIEKSLTILKKGKAPGKSGISIDFSKIDSKIAKGRLAKLFAKCLKSENSTAN